jgi:hypothetical protein
MKVFLCEACSPKEAEQLTIGVLDVRKCGRCKTVCEPGFGGMYDSTELSRLGVRVFPDGFMDPTSNRARIATIRAMVFSPMDEMVRGAIRFKP